MAHTPTPPPPPHVPLPPPRCSTYLLPPLAAYATAGLRSLPQPRCAAAAPRRHLCRSRALLLLPPTAGLYLLAATQPIAYIPQYLATLGGHVQGAAPRAHTAQRATVAHTPTPPPPPHVPLPPPRCSTYLLPPLAAYATAGLRSLPQPRCAAAAPRRHLCRSRALLLLPPTAGLYLLAATQPIACIPQYLATLGGHVQGAAPRAHTAQRATVAHTPTPPTPTPRAAAATSLLHLPSSATCRLRHCRPSVSAAAALCRSRAPPPPLPQPRLAAPATHCRALPAGCYTAHSIHTTVPGDARRPCPRGGAAGAHCAEGHGGTHTHTPHPHPTCRCRHTAASTYVLPPLAAYATAGLRSLPQPRCAAAAPRRHLCRSRALLLLPPTAGLYLLAATQPIAYIPQYLATLGGRVQGAAPRAHTAQRATVAHTPTPPTPTPRAAAATPLLPPTFFRHLPPTPLPAFGLCRSRAVPQPRPAATSAAAAPCCSCHPLPGFTCWLLHSP